MRPPQADRVGTGAPQRRYDSDDVAQLIAGVNLDLGIDGHRSDITPRRAARTLASFKDEPTVTPRIVRRATRMALEYRLKRLPFEEDETDPLAVFHDVRTELGLGK